MVIANQERPDDDCDVKMWRITIWRISIPALPGCYIYSVAHDLAELLERLSDLEILSPHMRKYLDQPVGSVTPLEADQVPTSCDSCVRSYQYAILRAIRERLRDHNYDVDCAECEAFELSQLAVGRMPVQCTAMRHAPLTGVLELCWGEEGHAGEHIFRAVDPPTPGN